MSSRNNDISEFIFEKERMLMDLLATYGSVAVAYSGGVDSTYLAAVAHEILGAKAHMVLADSPSIPRSEVEEASAIAWEQQWNFNVLHTQEFEQEAFLKNDGRRCYFCKNELFTRMRRFANEHDVAVLAYGAMADDALDPTRLGHVAAREHAVTAPLQDVGLTKDEIRMLSRRRGLRTASKASFACLSSRFPTGDRIEVAELSKVEQAEEVLKQLGFHQYRARHHGDTCRIEVGKDEIPRLLKPAVRRLVAKGVRDAGYQYVTLDLGGYRTGNAARKPANEPETIII